MVKKIVLTGGPGSGKTSVLKRIKDEYTAKGMKVIIVPETATEIINMGIKPFGEDKVDIVEFQKLVLQYQLVKENIVDKYMMGAKQDCLIIYDRGMMDGQAFVSTDEFRDVIHSACPNKDYYDLLNSYDLIINLVSRPDFYTIENNPSRSESAGRAMELGDLTLGSWLGHERLRVVKPKDKIEEKEDEVIEIIDDLLAYGNSKRQEKFVVDLDSSDLSKIICLAKKVKIEQIYLKSKKNIEFRIRKSMLADSVNYKMSIFRKYEDGRIDILKEENIDEATYYKLSKLRDENYNTIYKTRYYFTYNGEYLYLDVFDEQELGILEINVKDNDIVIVPDFLTILDKVSQSNNSKYSNMRLALVKKGA